MSTHAAQRSAAQRGHAASPVDLPPAVPARRLSTRTLRCCAPPLPCHAPIRPPLPRPHPAGYALAVYIPIACICILPVEAMRWAVLGAATVTSGLFLLLTFRRPILDSAGARALPLLLVLGALHLGLGLALKLYFFNYAA